MTRAWLAALLAVAACGGGAASVRNGAPGANAVLLSVQVGDVQGVPPHDVAFSVREAFGVAFSRRSDLALVTSGAAAYTLAVEVTQYLSAPQDHKCALRAELRRLADGATLGTVQKSRSQVGSDERPLDCARELARESAAALLEDLPPR